MTLTSSEKIKIILKRQGMTISELAEEMGTSVQNLSNKFSRNNLSEKEIAEIAKALNCKAETIFTIQDGARI